jgi:hypothetical protein
MTKEDAAQVNAAIEAAIAKNNADLARQLVARRQAP